VTQRGPRIPDRHLGELESAVLEVLWGVDEPVSVKDVQQRLRRRPALAYTTILTVLDRLHGKGVVARDKDGRAFLYRARWPREAFLGEKAVRALTDVQGPPNAVLLAFLESAEARDPELLDRLAALIAERRRTR
jgi:predicted transcriptional regulator